MTANRELSAVARLDLAEVLRSRWLIFCGLVYGLLAAMFVLVGVRESNVLGFTGMGRVLMSFTHALLLLLPLLALTATSQLINRARDDGTLEMLFSHPLSRGRYFLGITPLGVSLREQIRKPSRAFVRGAWTDPSGKATPPVDVAA